MRPLLLPLLVLVLATGCRRKEQPQADALTAPGTGAVQVATPVVKGTVLERLDVAPYSYLRLKTAEGEVWTAVELNTLATGAEATVQNGVLMTNWQSAQLNRTFERIYLGNLMGAPTAAPSAPEGMAAHPSTPPASVGDVKVPKAEGTEGRTIAEVFAQKGSLDGKTVAVRGKVVRVARGITMPGVKGNNWIHLQDGSGSAAKGDHDLTVTSDEDAKPGDVVVARGPVSAQKQVIMGMERPVMIQGAKLGQR